LINFNTPLEQWRTIGKPEVKRRQSLETLQSEWLVRQRNDNKPQPAISLD
jgi:hypothetical protein